MLRAIASFTIAMVLMKPCKAQSTYWSQSMYWRRKIMKNKSLPTRGEILTMVVVVAGVIVFVIVFGTIHG